MLIRSSALKFLLSIIVFSLMVPLSPAVSSAKAKICCKKNCCSMLSDTSQAVPMFVKHCNHQKSSRQCCDKVCAKFISFEKVKPFFFIEARAENDAFSEEVPVSILDRFIYLPELNLRFKGTSSHYKLQTLPIYLSNSVLRI